MILSNFKQPHCYTYLIPVFLSHTYFPYHFLCWQAIPLSSKFFHVLNPDFVLQMAQLLLLQSPTEPIRQGERVPDILKKCAGLLEPLSATAPGIIDTLYLLARVRYLAGEHGGTCIWCKVHS